MAGASLAVATIGQALAQARGLVTKHAVKRIDRLVSAGIEVWDSFARWVPHQVNTRPRILVAMDWTDFDRDDQSTLVLSLVTDHGRAAPLIWLAVWKEEIATRRNDHEDACLCRLAEMVPQECRVTILANRGFGDQKLFAFLGRIGFGYVIRFRGNIRVTDADGRSKPAAEWVGKSGRARKLRDARVTAKGQQLGAVVCVHAKAMKEPWCLAASDPEAPAAMLVNHYARRWTIEPQFRDTKDLRFGMGLSSTRVGEPTRRDRLLLVSAFAVALLTLLGAVGELNGIVTQRARKTGALLASFEPQTVVSTNIMGFLWAKTAYAAVLSASALTNVAIADSIADPGHRHLIRCLGQEVLADELGALALTIPA